MRAAEAYQKAAKAGTGAELETARQQIEKGVAAGRFGVMIVCAQPETERALIADGYSISRPFKHSEMAEIHWCSIDVEKEHFAKTKPPVYNITINQMVCKGSTIDKEAVAAALLEIVRASNV